jgi:hypothetical protein
MDVRLWLESIKLGDLAPKFKEEGYDTLARVATLTNDDLETMGIKRGYRNEILGSARSRKIHMIIILVTIDHLLCI